MAAFLSEEWIADLDRTLASSPGLARAAADVRLTIQQVIGDGQDRRAYVVRIDRGRVGAQTGFDPAADVTITQDLVTATEVARGALSAQAALMLGRIRLRGDVRALLGGFQCLVEADPVLAVLRQRTEW